MQTYDTFADALAEFRSSGGAMNHHQAVPGYTGGWQVGTCEEIQEATGHDPRGCTMQALYAGGMREEQVLAELTDWQPAAETRQIIECPLCGGSKVCGDHTCPECHGAGTVPNVFAELRHGRYETDEETAAAEGRPLVDVQAETTRAKRVMAAMKRASVAACAREMDRLFPDQVDRTPRDYGQGYESGHIGHDARHELPEWATIGWFCAAGDVGNPVLRIHEADVREACIALAGMDQASSISDVEAELTAAGVRFQAAY